jgi:hypothetical protein
MQQPKLFALLPDYVSTPDGMIIDGKLTRIAQSPDTDGLHGELDQPGEPR